MRQEEARVWECCLQVWAVLFCVTMLRYSPLTGYFGMPAFAAAEPLFAASGAWLVAGLLSMAFLCRLNRLGCLHDLSTRGVRLRVVASVPLGMVALIHSLYQIEQRDLDA